MNIRQTVRYISSHRKGLNALPWPFSWDLICYTRHVIKCLHQKDISSSDSSSSLPLIVEMKHLGDQQKHSAHDGMASQNKDPECVFQFMRIVPPSHIEQGHQLIPMLSEVGREIHRFTIHGASWHTEQSQWMECSAEGRIGLMDCLCIKITQP